MTQRHFTEDDVLALQEAQQQIGEAIEMIEGVLRGKTNGQYWTTYLVNNLKALKGGDVYHEQASLDELIKQAWHHATPDLD